jgi:outer membrane protein, heavy metal efflux system
MNPVPCITPRPAVAGIRFVARSLAAIAAGTILQVAAADRPAAAPDLPPEASAMQAILQHPAVAGARAGIGVEEANRRRLAAGTHEFAARVSTWNRHDLLASRNFTEWDVTIERGVRLPGKGALDAQLGDQGVDQARLAVGDARHEAARNLLRSWFGWARAADQARHWQAQRDLLQRQSAVVARRVQLGDAARQEQLLADAALAQAEASVLQAQLRTEVAASELLKGFPQIRLPAHPPLAQPQPVERDSAYWEARIAEHNHELAFARAEVDRRRTLAERARAERMPDPSIGVRVGSERAGAERIVGLVFSMPFGGAQRAAVQEGALAQIDVAAQRAAVVERRLGADSAATYVGATRAFETWCQSRAAAQALADSAAMITRAYQLGEGSLAEVLTAQRLALEARLAAGTVQVEAAEARYRLLLDAHELWDFDEP